MLPPWPPRALRPWPTRSAGSYDLIAGYHMAAHFDQILGDPEFSFYLACAPRVHMVLGDDYRDYVAHFRAGTTRSYQEHGEVFMREVAEALKTLPASAWTWCCQAARPGRPARAGRPDAGRGLRRRLGAGADRRAVPEDLLCRVDVEPYSVELAQRLIQERGLADRCQARAQSVDRSARRAPMTSTPGSPCRNVAARPGSRSPRRPPSPASPSRWRRRRRKRR